MNDIRKKAEKNPNIKAEWIQSIQPMIEMLSSRARRVQLKDIPFQVYPHAADDEVELAEAEVTLIDPTIRIGHYQQQHLTHANQLKAFQAKHCKERHYSFQIRRCGEETCCPPATRTWAWLPDPVLDQTGEHYKQFESLIGRDTTDKDRPSGRGQTTIAVAEEQQGCKNSILVAQNVRRTVICTEWKTPVHIWKTKAVYQRWTGPESYFGEI